MNKKKQCSECKVIKDRNSFYRYNRSKDKLQSRCKNCCKKYNARYNKEYYRLNKDKILKHKLLYKNNRYKTDINYRLKIILRSRFYATLKQNKNSCILDIVGCSIKNLKKHIEKQFVKGMSWSNYGKWHIDHIKPCASFDLSQPEHQKQCFHFTNLQPLWATDNLKKHCKIV